jgi:hypothetical protein
MNVDTHPYWHRFTKGMCLYCGYYCIDCPKGVAACKCTPKTKHIYEEECRNKHCKIHWYYSFECKTQVKFPEVFNILTSECGWVNQQVFCGPGSYYPKKVSGRDDV